MFVAKLTFIALYINVYLYVAMGVAVGQLEVVMNHFPYIHYPHGLKWISCVFTFTDIGEWNSVANNIVVS